jgi:hypothetical protein
MSVSKKLESYKREYSHEFEGYAMLHFRMKDLPCSESDADLAYRDILPEPLAEYVKGQRIQGCRWRLAQRSRIIA